MNYILALLGLSICLSGTAIGRLRVWNPSDGDWNPATKTDTDDPPKTPTEHSASLTH